MGMFDNRLKKDQTSSARICDELRSRGINMAGICRQDFFVRRLGMEPIDSFKIGRDHMLVFLQSDWDRASEQIVGANPNGYPILMSDLPKAMVSHYRRVKARKVAVPTVEDKLDLILNTLDKILQHQATYA